MGLLEPMGTGKSEAGASTHSSSYRIVPIDIMAFFLTLVSSILVRRVCTDGLQGLLGNIH